MNLLKSFLAISLATVVSVSCADTVLPKPQTSGGGGLFTLLKARKSAALDQFASHEPSLQELSNLLWAATGLNRDHKWTTPYAMGLEPYVTIYVASNQGVARYDWKHHTLQTISKDNIKAQVGLQPQVANTPMVLIFVGDTEAFKSFPESQKALVKNWPYIATGAITQNVYLAAASMKLQTRFIISVNHTEVKKALRLKETEFPINIMPIGK